MQVTEKNKDGLKRDYAVVVPAKTFEEKVEERLKEVGKTANMPGFRKGKAPLSYLQKRFGDAVKGEALDGLVQDATTKLVKENDLRPAVQPKLELTKFEEGQDIEFSVSLEVLPEFEVRDFKDITLEKMTVDIADKEVEEALGRIAEHNKVSQPLKEERPTKTGDVTIIDFLGKVDGEAFAGGKGTDYKLELGSNSFIYGFEDQLVGKNKGDEVLVKVTFPENYHGKDLAGKDAEFDVVIKDIQENAQPEMNDEFAKLLGKESIDEVREAIREEMTKEYDGVAKARLKRALLDALSDSYDFEVPQGLLDMEFDSIWKQFEAMKKQGRVEKEDEEKDEDELKAEYRTIAERRVRLGLLLSEVGKKHDITVAEEDVRAAIMGEARRYPGQEKAVFDYYSKNPEAMESLRAPIFEDKVVSYILELVKTTDKAVTAEELYKEPDAPEAAPKKKAKKKASKAKKATAKKASKAKKAGAKKASKAKKA